MRRHNPNTIQGALPLVARAVGRRLDVTVEIGGSDAYTDGTHIQLPALPLDMSSEDMATLAFGYLEHEAAHVRYTDMDNFKPDNGLHQMFTNIFEDVRIEKALGEEYPGFAEDLRSLTEILVRQGDMGGAQDPDTPLAAKMGEYVLLRSRHEVLGPDALKASAERAEAAFRNAVPPGLATRVGAALGRVRDLESTEDASNLAREVIRLVEEEEEHQREQADRPRIGPGNGSGQGVSLGVGGDEQGDGGSRSGEGERQSGDSGSQAGAGDDHNGKDSQGDGAGQDDAAKAAAEMAEALRQLLQDDGRSGPKGRGEAAAEALGEAAAGAPHHGAGAGAGVGKASAPLQVKSSGAAELAKVAAATVALRTRLRGLLAAAKQSRRCSARRGKRMDCRRLVKAMAGDPRIFVSKTQGIAVNTAVQILLDRSGTLCNQMALARGSALACGLGFAEIEGVSLATAAFPAHDGHVVPLTRFGEPVRRTAGRYASLFATGGTPMLEALLWGADQLLVQPEPRKMCLIVTDGVPNNRETTTEVIRRCWEGGIEVMGIGIGGNAQYVSDLFPVSANVNGVNELAAAMFAMLSQALAGRSSA
ncbi:MAG: hypothetical protein OXF98_11615 [Rhodospirillaceae bacterium]|nr:hypothetical protein [Rhodospirillaceae bacterium]